MQRWLIYLGLLLTAGQAAAVDEADLLPVDQAFAISAQAMGPDSVRLTWEIADGYYLYRHRFSFESTTPGVTLAEAALPPGDRHTDEFFGEVETYRGSVSADLPVHGAAPGDSVTIRARIQGCADVGVCYPPHDQTVNVVLAGNASAEPGPIAPSTVKGGAAQGLSSPLESPALEGTGSASPLGGASELNGGALPADEAFRFEAIALGPDQIGVRFTIAPGYYLYREKFGFELEDAGGASLGGWALPPGEAKTDEHFGDVRVFHDLLEFPLPVRRTSAASHTVTLVGRFQGCKEAGICYPPMERRVPVELPVADPVTLAAASAMPTGASASPAQPVSEQDRLAGTLLSGNLLAALGIFFVAGLLLAFTPCIFPMVPILAGILAGQGEGLRAGRAFGLSLVYVLAMAVTYTAAGVIAGVFGQNLQAVFQQPWILVGFAAVFVALALSMFGFYELQLPSRWQTRLTAVSNRQRGGTWAGVAVMGLLSALIVGPCVAPPLTAALIVIGRQGDPLLGGTALFALSLGMGTPLLILGASAGRLLPRAGAWMTAIKRVFGVLLLGLAIWILDRILPATVTMLLWAALLLTTGVYLGALDRVPEGASGWRRLWKALGLLLIAAGAVELVGAAAGGGNWMQPLRGLGQSRQESAASANAFRPVADVADLEEALANTGGRPVMLDYYADWCVECKRMETYTYSDPAVRDVLSGAMLLKADVTENDTADKALLQHFGLIGPPAVLFFTPDGRELPGYRVVGYMGAEEFARHARQAFGEQPGGRTP